MYVCITMDTGSFDDDDDDDDDEDEEMEFAQPRLMSQGATEGKNTITVGNLFTIIEL